MVLSLFFSVLDGDAQVVEVCGHFRVVHIHNARTQNINTIHVAADAAGLLPICHPVGQLPLPSPLQSKDQPPSPFPLSVFPPTSWFHMGPSCPWLPHAAIFHDGLSAPHVMTMSPPFFVGPRTSNAYTDGNGSTDPPNSFLAFQQQKFLVQLLFVCGRFVILSVLANGHMFHDVVSDTSVNLDHKSFGKKTPGNFLFRSHQRTRSLYPSRVIEVAPPTSPSDGEHHQTPIGFNPFGVSLATPMKELLRPSASPSCYGYPMPSTVPASASISHIFTIMFLVVLADVRLVLEIPVIVVFLGAAASWLSTQPLVELSEGCAVSAPVVSSSWAIIAACCGHRPFQPGLMFHVGVCGLFLRRPAPVACGSRSDPGLNCIRSNVARVCCNASCGDQILSTAFLVRHACVSSSKTKRSDCAI